MTHEPEAFSRVLVDDALRDSGWDILDSHQVQFEYNHIERLPSQEDLERVRLKNMQPPRPLLTEKIGADYCPPKTGWCRIRWIRWRRASICATASSNG